ncbi:MAG: glycosyltransferase family 2 protein [Lachnospiraceae bacterium]|nr:glycosyltransferase family 2 protein [Lachnospiraceae bacterium]
MTLQLLVAAVNKEALALAHQMHIGSDAIIVSQTDHYGYEEVEYQGNRIRYFAMAERGVGLSRNTSLLRAEADIILFADEDIAYEEGYQEKVLTEFEKHPEADMLLFNVQAAPGRETYHTDSFGRVRWYNCGRYPTYSFAVRRERVHKHNITFSLLFGGGAPYSNGEDSLFIRDCLQKGMKVYKVPVTIGKEIERPSTWFQGYNTKFFFDRGVLYSHLYGRLDKLMAIRFLLAHKGEMCRQIPVKKAFQIMCEGIKEGRR